MLDFFNENSGFAASVAALLSLLATLALIGVTVIYTRHTRRIAEGANEPNIRPWLYPRGANTIFLRLINCGTGAASDIEVGISFSDPAASKVWAWPFMAAGQVYEFKFIDPDKASAVFTLNEVGNLGHMTFVATYKALDGRKLQTAQEIDLERALQSSIEAQMIVTDDQPDRILVSIRDEIRKLHK